MTHPDNLKPTPFLPFYPPGVVEWIDVFGYAVPLTWGDVAAEYAAIREKAAIIEFSMLLKFDVQGEGAMDTFDKLFSRDVTGLKPGQIAYGVVTTEDGRMMDDCTVFCHSHTHMRVMAANPALGEALLRFAPSSVTITERRAEFAQLSLQGPKSRDILQRLTKTDVSNDAFPYYTFKTGLDVAGIPAQVNRLGFTGELGYEIMIPVGEAGKLWAAINEAGARDGLLPVGGAALMTARIETGLIMGGLDYSDDTTPWECRMGWAVDLDKRGFQGQAELRKSKASPRTKLVSVVFSAEGNFDGCELSMGGSPVGTVPMVVPSPCLDGRLLGLATVKAELARPGTRFSLPGHDGVHAEIVEMPVYERERRKVRS